MRKFSPPKAHSTLTQLEPHTISLDLFMPSILVDDKGTQLSYVDTGIPRKGAFVHRYVTIFAIHGFLTTNRESSQ